MIAVGAKCVLKTFKEYHPVHHPEDHVLLLTEAEAVPVHPLAGTAGVGGHIHREEAGVPDPVEEGRDNFQRLYFDRA